MYAAWSVWLANGKHDLPMVMNSNPGRCIGITFLSTPRVGFALSCIPLRPCFLPKNPSRPAVKPSKSSVSAAAPCALALLLGPCPCANALLLPADLTGCSSASVAHLKCTSNKDWPACNMLADMHECLQDIGCLCRRSTEISMHENAEDCMS